MRDPVRLTVSVSGLQEFANGLTDRADRITKAVASAIYVEAEQTIAAAKKITPVDEGVLRSSGHVRLPETSADGTVTVEFGFGGVAGTGTQGPTNEKDVGYAVYVHEDLTAYHRVGQAKYLETPVRERVRGLAGRLAKRVRQWLAGV